MSIPLIDPCPAADRPFWSVMIPSYNCAEYLSHTLESVLGQDPGAPAMEICVVDDCSTRGDPEAIVCKYPRVRFLRNESNLGAAPTFTRCIRESSGKWIHILHGDDMVLPGFYQRYADEIGKSDCVAVWGRVIFMDEDGIWNGISPAHGLKFPTLRRDDDLLFASNEVFTPSIVVSRAAYEIAGGFDDDLVHTNDWDMWLRLLDVGAMRVIGDRPYSLYRHFSSSDTGRLLLTGENVRDKIRCTGKMALREADPDLRQRRVRMARRSIAAGAAHSSRHLARKRRWRAAFLQAGWALRLHPGLRNLLRVCLMVLEGLQAQLRHRA